MRGNLALGVEREQLAELIDRTCMRYSACMLLFNADGTILLDLPDHDTKCANMRLCGRKAGALAACTRLRSSLIRNALGTCKTSITRCSCGGTIVAKPIIASSAVFGGLLVCLPPDSVSSNQLAVKNDDTDHWPLDTDHWPLNTDSWLHSFIDTLTAMIAQNSFKDIETESLSNELSVRYEELSLLYEIAEKLPLQTHPGAVIDFLIDQAWMVIEAACIFWVGQDSSPDKLFWPKDHEPDAISKETVESRAVEREEGSSLLLNSLLINSPISPAQLSPAQLSNFSCSTVQQAAIPMAHRTARELQPVAVNNLCDDVDLIPFADDFGSVLAVPVAIGDDYYGTLCVFNPVGIEVSSDAAMLMTSLARKAAAVIRNAKLYSQLNALFLNTVKTLVFVIEGKDAYTRGHSERVKTFSLMLAERLQLSPEARNRLNWSALLHDIGKINIPEAILKKPGRLTDAEWLVIKKHPTYGVELLRPIEQLADSLPEIEHHHERLDGTGYPCGLKGEDIPLGARIIAVADTFDALTSDRCYRPRFDPEQALGILREVAGTQLDADIVNALLGDPDAFTKCCQPQSTAKPPEEETAKPPEEEFAEELLVPAPV